MATWQVSAVVTVTKIFDSWRCKQGAIGPPHHVMKHNLAAGCLPSGLLVACVPARHLCTQHRRCRWVRPLLPSHGMPFDKPSKPHWLRGFLEHLLHSPYRGACLHRRLGLHACTVFVTPVSDGPDAFSVDFLGDAAAVARLNATVSSGLLKLTWNGDANLSTTAPLLVNVTLPASAKTLSVAVANSPGVVWLAPNLTLSCLSVAASNGGGVYGNITSDMTGVATNDAAVWLHGVSSSVQAVVSNAAKLAVYPSAGASPSLQGNAANAATIYCVGCSTSAMQPARAAEPNRTAGPRAPSQSVTVGPGTTVTFSDDGSSAAVSGGGSGGSAGLASTQCKNGPGQPAA
eukprot:scaffold7.g3496.t1